MNITDNLKGKTILIGKEPEQSRLLIAIKGTSQITTLGQIGSVPNSVSRCKPTEGVAHCQIEIDLTGNMTLSNMKAQNVTYVNGAEIMSKRIDATSTITLGKDKYAIDLNAILNAATNLISSIIPPEYSIKYLKDVWDEYSGSLKKIRIRQKNIGLLASIPFSFTMLGGALIAFVPEIQSFAKVFTAVAAIVMLYGLYKRFTDKSIEEIEQLKEKFQDKYVCPNPKCHHYLGEQTYKILKQNKNCPYCKCHWTKE